MALGKISGQMLKSNLLRDNEDLAFETNLLYLKVADPASYRIGIGTNAPSYLLDINGTAQLINLKGTEADIGNINIKNNTISSIGNLILQASSNNTISLSSNLTSTNKLLIGSSATVSRFPNAYIVISDTAAGIQQNENGNIGLIAEAVGTGATRNAGLYGVGYTAGAFTGQGVVGESHVSAADDTAPAVGIRGYANDTRTVGNNVGLYGDASNGIANYSLYLNSGDIYTAGAKTWYLNGNLTFNGAYSITIPTLALTNALPVTSGGTGVTTSTGTTNVVLSNSPTLVTPTIGVATATSINKVTITQPTTSATLTLVTGSTLVTSGAHSLTLTTTADSNVTFPTSGTLVNSAVTTLSSLSSVGTITTGTWSGLFGAVSGANLTNLTAGNLTGTIPSTVLGNSSLYIGTTQIALNRASSSLTLADVHFGTTDVSTSFTIPVGTTVARPNLPAAGNIRYNTDTTNYEGFNGLDWGKIGAGLTPTPVKTSAYTATEAQLVRCNSTNGSFVVYLPASPSDGSIVGVIDVASLGSFQTHPVSVVPSAGTTIESASDALIIDINNAYITFVYVLATTNWKMQETPNMLSDYTLQVASTTIPGAVKVDGTTIVINNQGVISATGGAGSSTLISVIGAAPISSSGGTTPTLSITKATASTDGYVSSTDWNVFNSKLSTIPTATAYVAGGIKIGTGLSIDGSGVVSVNASAVIPTASPSVVGGIRVGSGLSIDGNSILRTSDFLLSISGTSPISITAGSAPVVSIAQANGATNGYLSSTDWTTFNTKLAAVPMASANILGGIKVGSGLAIDGYGTLSATTAYSLPIATDTILGGVKVDGTSITIDGAGTLSVNGILVMIASSTTNTPVIFTTDNLTPGAANQLIINSDYAMYVTGTIIGKELSSANLIVCSFTSTICNNSGTITDSTTITQISNSIGCSVPTSTVDNANYALAISSGYKSSTNINWTVKLDLAIVS